MASKSVTRYENNPLLIGIEGLKLIFTNAKNVGIYAIVMTASVFILTLIAYVVVSIIDMANSRSGATVVNVNSSVDPAVVIASFLFLVIGLIAYFAISLLLFGVLEYAAAMTAKGKTVGLKESFVQVLKSFPAYLWMYIILIVKITLWSLLLIVPGFIMANRYILSGTVFFAEDKRGIAAIKRSVELTRGAWLTTHGGVWIWNMLSQGIATMVFWPGCVAVLYRQLAVVTDSNQPKPPAHILSWLTLIVPLVLFFLYLLFIGLIILIIATSSTAP